MKVIIKLSYTNFVIQGDVGRDGGSGLGLTSTMYESLTGVGWWLKYWETFIWWVILISSMYLIPTHAVAKSLYGSVLCKLKTSLLLIAECLKFSHQLYPADKDVHCTDPCTCILDTNNNAVSLYVLLNNF